MRRRRSVLAAGVTGCLLVVGASLIGQQPALQRPPEARRTFSDPSAYVQDPALLTAAKSEFRDTVDRFAIDGQAIQRFYNIPGSDERRARLRRYYTAWLAALPKIDFARLPREGQVDYVLLRTHVEYQVALLNREERVRKATAPLFANDIVGLQEQRQKLEFISADAAGAALAPIAEKVRQATVANRVATATPLDAMRAAQYADVLRGTLELWFGFYNGYDPAFTAAVPELYRETISVSYRPTRCPPTIA